MAFFRAQFSVQCFSACTWTIYPISHKAKPNNIEIIPEQYYCEDSLHPCSDIYQRLSQDRDNWNTCICYTINDLMISQIKTTCNLIKAPGQLGMEMKLPYTTTRKILVLSGLIKKWYGTTPLCNMMDILSNFAWHESMSLDANKKIYLSVIIHNYRPKKLKWWRGDCKCEWRVWG